MQAGMVFDPSDEEIVSYYLEKLVAGEAMMDECQYFIRFVDIYSTKPRVFFEEEILLPFLKSNQRFFFSHRRRISESNVNGKRPRRVVDDQQHHNHNSDQGNQVFGINGGYWKSSTGEKPILDEQEQEEEELCCALGFVNTLNFFEFNNEAKTRKDATKTKWLMYEYRLAGEKFQEWVMCKIKDTSRPEHDQYEYFWLDQLFTTLTPPLPLPLPPPHSQGHDHHQFQAQGPINIMGHEVEQTFRFPRANIVDGSSCWLQQSDKYPPLESTSCPSSATCYQQLHHANIGVVPTNDEDPSKEANQLFGTSSNSKIEESSCLVDLDGLSPEDVALLYSLVFGCGQSSHHNVDGRGGR